MTDVWYWIYLSWLAAADNQATAYASRIDGAVMPASPYGEFAHE